MRIVEFTLDGGKTFTRATDDLVGFRVSSKKQETETTPGDLVVIIGYVNCEHVAVLAGPYEDPEIIKF